MSDFYRYYERELQAINALAAEFGRKYPKVAGRLQLTSGGGATDPHVERLLQGFALLAGRVHHKIDDEFPELTDALLSVLYPHYLAPTPSFLTAEFEADPERTPLTEGFTVPRGSPVLTPPVPQAGGLAAQYRTAYPVKLWPVRVADARLQGPPWQGLRLPPGRDLPPGTAGVLTLQLEAQAGARFDQLSLDTLRFHLDGQPQVVADLYEAVVGNASRISLIAADRYELPPIDLDPSAVRPVGFGTRDEPVDADAIRRGRKTDADFETDEGLLPYPAHSFPGYRLLTELFAYPDKFWFVDLTGLGAATGFAAAPGKGFGRRMDVLVFLKWVPRNLAPAVDAGTFRLGCTPCVNLFEHKTRPVPLTQQKYEYLIGPEGAPTAGLEVYSVDAVYGVADGAPPVEYRPFFAVDHPTGFGQDTYWYASRRPVSADREESGEVGTDVYLTLVDRQWDPLQAAPQTLDVRATFTNRQAGEHLAKYGLQLPLTLEAVAPPVRQVHCRGPATAPSRPGRNRRGAFWRLVSHLSLNHLSLTADDQGRTSLQEILRLYDPTDGAGTATTATAPLIEGLLSVATKRAVERVTNETGTGFCRGVEVTVELDEEKYKGVGGFLFAGVLDHFLGLYTTLNSFTTLVAMAKSLDGKTQRLIRRCPPRAGTKPLI
jgi:type VI secretion system protein ImpG